MTREEMWKEFENQLIRETRTPITESYDVSERMTKSAIEETVAKWKERLEHEPCDDAISREEVMQSKPEWLNENVERDTSEQTLIDREYSKGWNKCLQVFLDNIKQLPSAKPATVWHKIKTRPLTEEEKDEMYLNDNYYTFMYDCKMPDDEQEVLIKTKWGIEKTTYHTDDGCYFEDYEDEDDVIAWTELPECEE